MHKVLLATAAMAGLFTLSTLGASAAPYSGLADIHRVPAQGMVTNVDYYWHHHHYHHRHWNHDHWRYWD